jgi:hypothetical protein
LVIWLEWIRSSTGKIKPYNIYIYIYIYIYTTIIVYQFIQYYLCTTHVQIAYNSDTADVRWIVKDGDSMNGIVYLICISYRPAKVETLKRFHTLHLRRVRDVYYMAYLYRTIHIRPHTHTHTHTYINKYMYVVYMVGPRRILRMCSHGYIRTVFKAFFVIYESSWS